MAKIKIWGEYIVVKDGNSFSVYQSFKYAKPALKKICDKLGLPYSKDITTRQIGEKVLNAPMGTTSYVRTIGNYVVMRNVRGTYYVYREIPANEIDVTLRKIAKDFEIPYDPNSTPDQIGDLLIN